MDCRPVDFIFASTRLRHKERPQADVYWPKYLLVVASTAGVTLGL